MAHDLGFSEGRLQRNAREKSRPSEAGEESASLGVGVKFSGVRRPNPNGLFAISVGAAR